MNTKQLLALLCAASIIATTGCSSGKATSQGETSQSSAPETTDSGKQMTEQSAEQTVQTSPADEQGETKALKVTAVDGSTVTAAEGVIVRSENASAPQGEPLEKPAGSDGGENGGNAPEPPSGEAGGADSAQGTPPEKPEGADNTGGADNAQGTPPEKPSAYTAEFVEDGSEVTFTLTDSTEITVERNGSTEQGSAEDITVGSVLQATLGEDGSALSVTVKSLDSGFGGMGGQGGPGGFGGSSTVTNGTAANTISENVTESDATYSSIGDDENALRVEAADVTLSGITVNKNGGSSSNTENGDFYGQNAALLALNGANVTITDSTFTTDAVNGNAVFSYGEGTTVTISDSVIRTTQRNSGGIQTTGGGTTIASNLDVETQGNSSAAIRSDRGGGTVNVTGGKYVTNGTGSPAVYCTADITVQGAELTANASEGIVVEGKNSVAITDCDVTCEMSGTYNGDSDENIHAIMIYQSMSGDADVGEAHFSAEGGSVTALAGDMFYVTNTACTIALRDVDFTLANDVFLRVEGNSSSRGWGTQGANGGDVTLTASEQTIEGDIIVDGISSLDMTLTDCTLTGAVNAANSGGAVSVTLAGGTTWKLTADSYLSEFNGDISAVESAGYHLYVNGEQLV